MLIKPNIILIVSMIPSASIETKVEKIHKPYVSTTVDKVITNKDMYDLNKIIDDLLKEEAKKENDDKQ